MPRPKIHLSDMPGFDCWKFGAFKSYSSDLLFDFETILKLQSERFADFLSDKFKDEVEADISALHKAASGLKLMNDTRIYLITEFDQTRLVLYNLEDCIFKNLGHLKMLDKREKNDLFGVDPSYVVTLFAFRESELSCMCDVSISTAMELLIAFKKENLVNAGTFRNVWYGEPRRIDRAERRSLAIDDRE